MRPPRNPVSLQGTAEEQALGFFPNELQKELFHEGPGVVIACLLIATAPVGVYVLVGRLLQTWLVRQPGEPERCSVTTKSMDPADSRVNRLQSVGGTLGTVDISANYFNFLLLTGASSIKKRR